MSVILSEIYQLYQDDYNYMRDIRIAVEELCAEREANGEEWGTLGYMVGEVWSGDPSYVDFYSYNQNALRSAFDFPLRWALIKALAVNADNESGSLSDLNFYLDYEYPSHAQPNLFLSNHDLIRFGDLVQMAGY